MTKWIPKRITIKWWLLKKWATKAKKLEGLEHSTFLEPKKRWVAKGTKRWPYKKKIKEEPIKSVIIENNWVEEEFVFWYHHKHWLEQSSHNEEGEIDLENVTIYNLTGHDIVFASWYTIHPSSCVRCEESETLIAMVWEIPVYQTIRQKTILPKYNPKKIYIVSNIICQVHNDRKDIALPIKINRVEGDTYCKGIQLNPFYIEQK